MTNSSAENPLVSVIIPVYNAAKYVHAATQSILDQTYRNLELIIINDGSADQSENIIKKIQDPRIFLFSNKNNAGLVATLNRGLKLAKGTFIARFDADDIAMPERIETQLNFYKKNDIDIIGSFVEKTGNGKGVVRYPQNNDSIKISLLFSNPLVHPTIFFHRRLIDTGSFNYDKNWKHVEDYELWVRLMNDCSFANIPKVLLSYRVSDDSVCSLNNEEQKKRNEELHEMVLNKILPGHRCSGLEKKWLNNANSLFKTEELIVIKEFISSLVESNKKANLFSVPLFSKLLSERFLSSCLVSNKFDQKSLAQYLQLLKIVSVKRKMEPILRLFSKGIVNNLK